MAKRPTLVDVSAASGMSVYTVSRAINNQDGVSESTRARVVEVARKLGYVPNRVAQELRRNTRSSVAVLTASTANYYYIEMMRGVQRVVRAHGRTVVVADIASEGVHTSDVEDATVEGLIRSRTAGVISSLTLSARNVARLKEWDIPIIFVDSAPPAGEISVGSFTTDNYGACQTIGDHLAGHGLEEWLLIIYPALWSTRTERERGLRDAAARHGARLTVLESPNDADSAHTTLSKHLAQSDVVPDVVVAGNNPMLHGALRALQDAQLGVAADVAVVAFDEFAWSGLLHTPVTVLNEQSDQIGELAARSLMRIIDDQVDAEREGQRPTPVYSDEDRRQLGADLVVRQSCGCP